MLTYVLTFGLLVFSSLCANPIPASFQELSQQDFLNREVTIRGFLYLKEDGNWILAAEPNLKTCCLGSTQKAKSQIILDSNFEGFSSNKVVLIQGNLTVEKGLFHLQNSKVLEDNEKSPFILLGGLSLILGCIGLMLNRRWADNDTTF
jgi:hypothetical protein